MTAISDLGLFTAMNQENFSNKRKSVGLGSCRVAFVRRNTCKVLLTYWDFTFIKILVIYEKICNFGAKAFKHDIQQV